ncbi:MAG: hypothetical protein JY451_12375 [Erythrobacter sp.]|nr:MAG: hypothetical protein JY451_12375 [Erythrobacter sp.]
MRRMFAVIAALLLAACNPFAVMDSADEEIAAFHSSFNGNQWEAIYNQADAGLREATTREGFDGEMVRMRETFGAFMSGEQTGFNINTENGVTTTEITYDSTFENGTATETFIFVGEGEDMALLGWTIEQTGDVAAPAADVAAEAPADAPGKAAAPAEAAPAPAPAGGKPAAPTQAATEAAPPKPVG